MNRLSLCLAAGLLVMTAAAQDKPKIKQVPISPTSPASGAEMFKAYCSSCHGLQGKGDGPAAPALKARPTDLTELSVKNGGKFPASKVLNTIRGDTTMPAHGSKDMPVWGVVLASLGRGDAEVKQRMSNLTKYVESLQGGK